MELGLSTSINRLQPSRGGGGGGGFTGLLDTYPGATLAYSTRRLSSSYMGAALRVKRSSDSAEMDIGFVNNTLDTACLTTFLGANSGSVVIWYDQSGNSNNITPEITNQEPFIYQSGSTVTLGGFPSLISSGVTLEQLRVNISIPQPYSFSLVSEISSSGSAIPLQGTDSNEFRVGPSQTFRNNIFVGNFLNNTTTTGLVVGDPMHQVGIIDGATSVNAVNSNAETGSLATTGLSALEIFPPNFVIMKIMEVVVYPTNQEANRVGIQSEVNTYYSIY